MKRKPNINDMMNSLRILMRDLPATLREYDQIGYYIVQLDKNELPQGYSRDAYILELISHITSAQYSLMKNLKALTIIAQQVAIKPEMFDPMYRKRFSKNNPSYYIEDDYYDEY